MAIYVRAVKTSETDDSVTYRWGIHYEAEDGTFTIPKLPAEQILQGSLKDYGLTNGAVHVFMKIMKYYKSNGTFPETCSYQA